MKTTLVMFALLTAGAQGCSTVLNGGTQPLWIATVPPGATATIGMQTCVTPCSLEVRRNAQTLDIRKGNYDKTFDLDKDFKFGSTICGNILWLVPGLIVDLVVGGAYEIRPVNLILDTSVEGARNARSRD